MSGSVYSSTDQINLLKNIFTPQFQVGQGGYFRPTVHTYLPGDVEIGDPTTNYNLFLNGNALATDLKIAAWSGYPAISTLSMGANNITNAGEITLCGGNYLNGAVGSFQRLSNVRQLNGFDICLGSALTIGTDKIFLGTGAGVGNTGRYNQVCIGCNAGLTNTKDDLIAIGQDAGQSISAGNYSVCIGFRAGIGATNAAAVQIGNAAGRAQNGLYPVMIGLTAGDGSVGNQVIGIGLESVSGNRGSDIVAIGQNAAANNSGSYVVAAGYQAGQSNRGSSVVALGFRAGFDNSGNNCIFLGSNSSAFVNTANTSNNTFYVYSTTCNTPFLQGDMSANVLGIGTNPRPGFALTVQGSVQNRLNLSATSGTLRLTAENAATRFFVSNTVTLSFATGFTSGTHWILTNTSTAAVTANLCGGTVQNSISLVTLPATISGVGRGVTFASTGTVGNFYSF
jgi:hypothetical protein